MKEDDDVAAIFRTIELDSLVVPVTRAILVGEQKELYRYWTCLLYTSPSPRD